MIIKDCVKKTLVVDVLVFVQIMLGSEDYIVVEARQTIKKKIQHGTKVSFTKPKPLGNISRNLQLAMNQGYGNMWKLQRFNRRSLIS